MSVRMLEQVLAIALVLGLLLGSLLLLRRKGIAQFGGVLRGRSSSERQIEIIDRVALGAGHSLQLVAVRDRVFLIGISPSGCRRIGVFRGSAAAAFPVRNEPGVQGQT